MEKRSQREPKKSGRFTVVERFSVTTSSFSRSFSRTDIFCVYLLLSLILLCENEVTDWRIPSRNYSLFTYKSSFFLLLSASTHSGRYSSFLLLSSRKVNCTRCNGFGSSSIWIRISLNHSWILNTQSKNKLKK